MESYAQVVDEVVRSIWKHNSPKTDPEMYYQGLDYLCAELNREYDVHGLADIESEVAYETYETVINSQTLKIKLEMIRSLRRRQPQEAEREEQLLASQLLAATARQRKVETNASYQDVLSIGFNSVKALGTIALVFYDPSDLPHYDDERAITACKQYAVPVTTPHRLSVTNPLKLSA